VQGIGAAATRVLAVTIVRDCYSGATMARVMSLTFIVFLAAPIVAPSIGQTIMLFVSWHWIFGLLAIYGVWALVWGARKLPETLHPEDRLPLSARAVGHALWLTLTTRVSIFYILAVTLIFGALFGFINSVQQIFDQTFHAPNIFPAIFAAIAAFMAVSSFVNSRIVEKLGTRLVSHTALIGFTLFAAAHMITAFLGHEGIWTFALVQGGQMFCFGLIVSNFNSMAMEPMGHIAGTASSVQGFMSTTGGALLGFVVGQQFNGTTLPLGIGFFAFASLAIVCVLFAEKGRMFQRLPVEVPEVR
jgi:DHA1 family bicyclomycin/chloramphenicol resistance-like MFS transporter